MMFGYGRDIAVQNSDHEKIMQQLLFVGGKKK